MNNNSKVATYLSLTAMIVFTVIELVNKQTSVFYILYLFWFDECIKTFFDRIKYQFKRNQIDNPLGFKANVKQRFFFLFVYFIFIVILFGLVMDRKDFDLIGINLTVLTFKNSFFNYSLLTFILRELYLYCNTSEKSEATSIVSNGVIILHISIILGIFIWFLSTRKFQLNPELANILVILPFLFLKLFFEIKSAK